MERKSKYVATKLAKEKTLKTEAKVQHAEERRKMQMEQAKPMAKTDPTARVIASGVPESVVAQKVMERVETLQKWVRGEATLDKVVELEGYYSEDSDQSDQSGKSSQSGQSHNDAVEEWPEWYGIDSELQQREAHSHEFVPADSDAQEQMDNDATMEGGKIVLSFPGTTVTVLEDLGMDDWMQPSNALKPIKQATKLPAVKQSLKTVKKSKTSLTSGKNKANRKGSWSREKRKTSSGKAGRK